MLGKRREVLRSLVVTRFVYSGKGNRELKFQMPPSQVRTLWSRVEGDLPKDIQLGMATPKLRT